MQTKTTFKFLGATFMSIMLAACGGGSGSALNNTGNNATSSSTGTISTTIRIGSGTGVDFVPTVLTAEDNAVALFTDQTTAITANVVDETGTLITTPVNVVFSSPCLDANTSSIAGGKTIATIGGIAKAQYKVGTCFGDDIVKASVTISGKTVSATVKIPQINNKRIGSDSGNNFTPGLIVSSVASTLFSGDVTKLSVNIVDNQSSLVSQASQVTFSSPCITAGTSTIAGGSTVTSINGVAKADYKVGTCNADDKVTATITNGSSTSEATITLPIDTRRLGTGFGSNFVNGSLEVGIGTGTLAPGGVTTITAYVVNSNGDLVTDPLNVSFSSPCLSSGNAAITGGNTVATTNGKAIATYTSNGCAGSGGTNGVAGTDAVKATLTFRNADLIASANISVKADSAQTISFVDATPTLISLKGTGGLETSIVRFRVLGQGGSPLSGICVNFSPSTKLGGLDLVPSKCNPAGTETYGSTTDSNGYASTTVQAGTVSTAVRVTATTSNGISTQSSALAVTTGIPDQNSMSLSFTDISPMSWNVDGVESTATIRMADAFQNPVPDGTTATFRASGGSIDASCQTVKGACSVTWRSQNPRPVSSHPVSFSNTAPFNMICPLVVDVTIPDTNIGTVTVPDCRSGRVKVLATAIGNESFIDGNGNGLYDDVAVDQFGTHGLTVPASPLPTAFVNNPTYTNSSQTPDPDPNENACRPNAPDSSASVGAIKGCDDLPEAYLDSNLNGFHSQNEEIVDFNTNNSYDLPNGKYDGALCAGAAKINGLCTNNTVTVRDDSTITMSCNTPFLQNGGLPGQPSSIVVTTALVNTPMLLADCNGNGMPGGTTVAVKTDNLVNGKATISPTGALPMSIEPGIINLFITPDAGKTASGVVVIDVTSKGLTTSIPVRVN